MMETKDSVAVQRHVAPHGDYAQFIEEVFIKPIRTAVVLDDEFPTIDQFLSDPEAALKKRYADKALDIVNFCRSRKPFPWIVDIHDGQNISLEKEFDSATHFDHTDLLVLDYHLRGEQHGGELAINVLKKLAANDHFNLVIIYTNNDVSKTLREIGLSLSYKEKAKSFFCVEPGKRVVGIYEAWIDNEDPIVQMLLDSIDSLAFIKAIHMDEIGFKHCFECEEFLAFKEVLETKKTDYDRQDMLRLFLRLKSNEYLSEMDSVDYGDVDLSERPATAFNPAVNWLKVDSLFLTIIKKADVLPEQFCSCLISAITSWDPSPHRLIVSKMRSEISKRGVMVEKEVLQNPYLQAAWLADLFDVDPISLSNNIRRNVAKHWDSLGGRVEPAIVKFAEQLGQHISVESVSIERFYRKAYTDSKLATLHVNHYVCSKKVEGYHLFTGHIFEAEGELWVCLTPACDLEPGRNVGKGVNKNLGEWKPFKAARIEALDDYGNALENATRGYHLFLSIDGKEPKAYCFSPDADPTLKWQQFYAGKQGVFDQGTESFSLLTCKEVEGILTFEESKVKVVAQLRYEYALHLLHKLGNHLSRVGLDFIAFKKV